MNEDDEDIKKELVSATAYFKTLKSKVQKMDDEKLKVIYQNCLMLFDKAQKTRQVDAMKKLIFHISTIEKEHAAIAAGIDTFVYLQDVEYYIDHVSDRVAKTIELERYEREIPDEVIEKFEKVKDLFSRFIVLFTDYTEVHVEKAKKERDPILFGLFQDQQTQSNSERLYFIGDWEDEYCDLTLDRLVSEMRVMHNDDKQVVYGLHDTTTIDELRQKLKDLEEERTNHRVTNGSALFSVSNTTNGQYLNWAINTPVQELANKNEDIEKPEPMPTPEVPKKVSFIDKIKNIFIKK